MHTFGPINANDSNTRDLLLVSRNAFKRYPGSAASGIFFVSVSMLTHLEESAGRSSQTITGYRRLEPHLQAHRQPVQESYHQQGRIRLVQLAQQQVTVFPVLLVLLKSRLAPQARMNRLRCHIRPDPGILQKLLSVPVIVSY